MLLHETLFRSGRLLPAAFVAVLTFAHASAAVAGPLPLSGRAAFAGAAQPALCPVQRPGLTIVRNLAARSSLPAALPWCLPAEVDSAAAVPGWIRLRPAATPAAVLPSVAPSPRSTRGPPGM